MLNLLGTTDFKNIIEGTATGAAHAKVMAKLNQIWHGSHRPKASEALGKLLGKQIGYPGATRWNSLYDCVKELLQYEEHLNGMLDATKTTKKSLPAFSDRDIKYMKEFVQLMAPVAFALDSLQGDKQIYYGRLLPTLFSLKTRLEMMQGCTTGFTVIGPTILPQLISALQQRFFNEFELNEPAKLAVLAAVSHPLYKLRWTFGETLERKAREMFMDEVSKIVRQEAMTQNRPSTSASQSSQSQSDFIILRPSAVNTNMDEGRLYLEDMRESLDMLQSYPAVLKVFKRSNTPLCSSAPLERIFNYAGIINNPKRGAIVPKNFENSVVLKGNQVFRSREQEDNEDKKKSKK